ncbi:unnamed protein product [Symbiodinium pilosum]|uniref:Exostosin GT47 domain-containing protein n=1 Tax=Symbiodinium pilosum TaxID=2952 RepID=A0A812QCF8_SYMPI|nr:unnamed protein product [Symbiodinium pilosum]
MASVLLHSLPYIDRDMGEAAAAEAYREAQAFLLQGSSDWVINLTWHDAARKLLVAGLVDPTSCLGENRFRFYVYDLGDYTRPLLSCASGMEGSEVLLHRWMLQSRCRTLDPEAADFFYVPFYSFCFQLLGLNLHIKPGTETLELEKHNVAVVKSLQYFDVYRRRQHIFHFAHEFWDFPSWEAHVGRSKIFAVEANPLIDVENYRHCVSCFEAWKDMVVPGHTDAWAVRRLRERRKPLNAPRRFRLCFHGALRHELYEKTHAKGRPFNGSSAADVRRQIQALSGEPDASIGPHITPLLDYYDRVGDCSFCLVPKGVGYTNGRLFEAFFAGCVPVILSDAMVVPFQAFLPWSDFSIKLPMGDVAAVVRLLRALPATKLSHMQESLLQHACWFDYYSEDPDCSPYEGLLRVLEEQQPREHWEVKQLPRFWAPLSGAAFKKVSVKELRRSQDRLRKEVLSGQALILAELRSLHSYWKEQLGQVSGELLPNSIPCKGPAKAPTDRDAGSEDLSKGVEEFTDAIVKNIENLTNAVFCEPEVPPPSR